MSDNMPSAARPRVVIVGAGFGGLAAARALAGAPVEVVVVDRQNYHLFQPLLYQVATAGLSPADIAWPIRGILRRQRNAKVLLGRVSGIDTATRTVTLDGRDIGYDFLILATGARHSYFGRDDWERAAPGLKKIDDATAIRRRVLLAFEQAEGSADLDERRRLLNFVVIGGGPTGVELAGAIAELAKVALAQDFRTIDPREARVVLIEAGPRLLSTFPEALSRKAEASLQRLGVEVRTGKAVVECDADGIMVGGERLPSRTVLWAAGVMASPAAKWLGVERDRAGRIVVAPDFSVPGHPDVFAVGDTAAMRDAAGLPVPGVAPAAKQGGRHVARTIMARLSGCPAPAPFRYRNWGNMATIGRKSAVCDFGWMTLTGFPAWLLWGVAHVYFLIGLRNRSVVALNWLWSYLTFQRGARLITGGGP
jgi:NADH dehydrogenase FAD-containing subunit